MELTHEEKQMLENLLFPVVLKSEKSKNKGEREYHKKAVALLLKIQNELYDIKEK